jgi:hypothetical protein
MATAHKWAALSSQTTVLTPNSLGTGAMVLSSAVDNRTNKHTHLQFEMYIGVGSAPNAGTQWKLWILPTQDDTNYSEGSASEEPMTLPAYVFTTYGDNSQHYHVSEFVEIPPQQFKILLKNDSGQTTASSGNTVKIVTGYYEST